MDLQKGKPLWAIVGSHINIWITRHLLGTHRGQSQDNWLAVSVMYPFKILSGEFSFPQGHKIKFTLFVLVRIRQFKNFESILNSQIFFY